MKKHRLGVVGCGGISAFHFPAFHEIPNVAVTAVVDVDEGRARPRCEEFGARYHADWRELMADDIDVVAVFTPTRFHYEIVKAALAAGKHVLCEKTLTLTGAESLELGRLAEANERFLFTSYMKRYFPATQQAKALMPRLGRIISVSAKTWQGPGEADAYTGPAAKGHTPVDGKPSPMKRLAGGGILIAGLSHTTDLLLHLLPELPVQVYGRQYRNPTGDVDQMTHALLDLPELGHVQVQGVWHALPGIGFEGKGWEEVIEISGVQGRLVLEFPNWAAPHCNPAQLRYHDAAANTWHEYRYPIVNPFAEAEKAFYADLARGQQSCQDRFTGYRTDLVLETTQQSVDAGTPLELRFAV